MPQPVKLGGNRRAVPPPPKQLPAPPAPAKPLPPGVKGVPPLPSDRVVGTVAPSSLTPAELSALEGVGWTPDIPIPTNFADVFDSIKAERAAQVDLSPVDPRQKPLAINTVPIEELPPGKRDELRATMQRMVAENQAEAARQQEEAERQIKAQAIPGLSEAIHLAQKVTEKTSSVTTQTMPDSPESQEPIIEVDKPLPAPAKSSTGADAKPGLCPHCNGDLSQVAGPEPSYEDKQAFIHCLLGQKPFSKEIELFNGSVTVTFRTLTLPEIEAVYAQTYADEKAGRIKTELDYWEKINRYRLALQLQQVKSPGPKGIFHDLPDGLSKETNPDAQLTWQEQNAAPPEGETLLPEIESHIVTQVLKQEALFRVVNTRCNEFNRTVSKMEAMADNSDFWKRTVEQS